MASAPNGVTGWKRHLWFLTSRKSQIALVTIISAIAAQYGWDITSKENTLIAVVGVAVTWMLSIAVEDHGSKMGLPPSGSDGTTPPTLPPNG